MTAVRRLSLDQYSVGEAVAVAAKAVCLALTKSRTDRTIVDTRGGSAAVRQP